MTFFLILLIAAAVFGLCFAVDKAFAKLFRSKAQHRSGLAVRANKRYGLFGVILSVLGIMAVCVGIADGSVLLWGGVIVLLMGICLAVYYLSFGVFYDGETFLLSRFGKKHLSESRDCRNSIVSFRLWDNVAESFVKNIGVLLRQSEIRIESLDKRLPESPACLKCCSNRDESAFKN